MLKRLESHISKYDCPLPSIFNLRGCDLVRFIPLCITIIENSVLLHRCQAMIIFCPSPSGDILHGYILRYGIENAALYGVRCQ